METLDSIVFHCLTNAVENNYPLSESSLEIAHDLEAKVDVLEGFDVEHLIGAVDTWRTAHQNFIVTSL